MKLFGCPVLLSVLLFLTMAIGGGCNDIEMSCRWTDAPIAIDGNLNDWGELPVRYFEDQKAVVALANDSAYLYLQLRTKDEPTARSISMTGLTLFVDPTGKKEKDFFVKFRGRPLHISFPESDRKRASGGKADRRPPDRPSQLFSCFVKDRILEKPIPIDGSQGPAVACDTSFGFVVYEFRIPLAESQVRYYGLSSRPGAEIAVGVLWGDGEQLRSRTEPPDRGGMGGGAPMGGRGNGGGRGAGGRKGGPGGSQPELPQRQEIWFKTELASLDSQQSE